jgi:hypothetical protein
MSPLQMQVLEAVREHVAGMGFSQTRAELAEQLDVTPGTVDHLIEALIRHGQLTRLSGQARNLRIAGQPDLRLVDTASLKAELARRGETLDALTTRELPNYAGKSCAADSCQAEVRRGQLFCRTHWFSLPRDLREAILQAHRRRDLARYQELLTRARDLIDMGVAA